MVRCCFCVVAETLPGINVKVVGSLPSLGQWNADLGLPLSTDPGKYPRWSADVELPSDGWPIEYKFVKVFQDEPAEWESGENRRAVFHERSEFEPQAPRFGQPGPQVAILMDPITEPAPVPKLRVEPPSVPSPVPPFVLGMDARSPSASPSASSCVSPRVSDMQVHFQVECTSTRPGDVLRIVGSTEALGNWVSKSGLQLSTTSEAFPLWSSTASMPSLPPVEWKVVISRSNGSDDWESCSNRCISLPKAKVGGSWRIKAAFQIPNCVIVPCILNAASPRRDAIRKPNAFMSDRRPTRAGSECGVQDAKMNRSTSLSHFLDPCAPAADVFQRNSRKATVVLRDEHPEISIPVQALRLRLKGISNGDSLKLDPQAILEGSERQLDMTLESTGSGQCSWTCPLHDKDLPTGLLFFHFAVAGERVLSSDHKIIGNSNAVLINEPLHRYVNARKIIGDVNNVSSIHVPLGRSATQALPQIGGDEKIGMRATSQNKPFKVAKDDGDARSLGRNGAARPHSIAFNLSELGNEDLESTEVSQGNVSTFSLDVFKGLFDGELRLRIDGFMLPDTTESRETCKRLRFWSGAETLKKKFGVCEDAHFTNTYALGVADGVGCMIQFARFGVNAAAYAAELMEKTCAALESDCGSNGGQRPPEERACVACMEAENSAEEYGASTISVSVLDGTTLGVANLGDSGFMVLRKVQRGMTIVARSEEQQHSWNCPYQLTRLPAELVKKFPKMPTLDRAADSEKYSVPVREGDLIIMFSDGMRDNLHDHEILHIVDCALSPVFGELLGLPQHITSPEVIARSLAFAAQERSLDPTARVPFVEYSKRQGYQCLGGKQDDITVLAAWAIPDDDRGLFELGDPPMLPAAAKLAFAAQPSSPLSPLRDETTTASSPESDLVGPRVSCPNDFARASAHSVDSCAKPPSLDSTLIGVTNTG